MKIKRIFALPVAALLLLLMGAAPAFANGTVTYTGQGFDFDGTTHNLIEERCGVDVDNAADDGGTGQFADWHGPGQPYQAGDGYLLWVLTANGAGSATIHLPDGSFPMIKVGGTFKYASEYYPYADLVGLPVTATYSGRVRGSVQLVVSHGCQPFLTDGAWCSPGYWKNARDAAWTLISVEKTDLFNDVVVPDFYFTPSGANPSVYTVLTHKGSANFYGGPDDPYGLNAFNATGAALTALIPGATFDPTLVGAEDACPIDNHGNFKIDQD